jgi:hypothetical protein
MMTENDLYDVAKIIGNRYRDVGWTLRLFVRQAKEDGYSRSEIRAVLGLMAVPKVMTDSAFVFEFPNRHERKQWRKLKQRVFG